MAARKRNRVASACGSQKARHLRSSMSRPSPVGRHRDSKSSKDSSKHAKKRRAVRELVSISQLRNIFCLIWCSAVDGVDFRNAENSSYRVLITQCQGLPLPGKRN